MANQRMYKVNEFAEALNLSPKTIGLGSTAAN
jgi:hypothetical protein